MARTAQKAAEMMLVTGNNKNNGFQLIEVIMSVVILSMSLTFILNSFMGSLRAIQLSEDYFKGGLLLEEKMFELYNSDVEKAPPDGNFTNFNDKFSWELKLTDLEEAVIKKVNLEVLWKDATKNNNISILTYLYTLTPQQ